MPQTTSPRLDPQTAPSWIGTRPGLPYFVTEAGEPWTPIGQNDAITWPELAGLFRRRDLPGVRRHLLWLKNHGVTCLRLMMEYAQREHRYLERPVGRFMPAMVQLWDDLFALCEEIGLHLLLTPFDTFFMWNRWRRHPYNSANGGPCGGRETLLTCGATREAIKARFAFASRRWGASPALFAWDLWNELHPAQGGGDPAVIAPFVADLGVWLREFETGLHGRPHLQTASIFGPELLNAPALCEPIFRHPALDFASVHLYEEGTIDDPADTVSPALATGRLMRAALDEVRDLRPVLDSEHGPIHSFKDKHLVLPAPFDDEYFRHMQWAHLASGGAGGGMRWPNRRPHVLTPGMREAQRHLGAFLPLIDWARFRRRSLNGEIACPEGVAAFGCGDREQAVVWLLRTDSIGPDGMLRADVPPVPARIEVPGLAAGAYLVTPFETRTGRRRQPVTVLHDGGRALRAEAGALVTDLALAIVRRS